MTRWNSCSRSGRDRAALGFSRRASTITPMRLIRGAGGSDEPLGRRADYEAFQAGDIDARYLLMMVQVSGELGVGCGRHEYPFFHRLHEIVVRAGIVLTVGRCILCDRVTFSAPHEDFHEELGVPYELEGSRLRRWAMLEHDEPTKGPTDWRAWLDGRAPRVPRMK
jgi:hypothetical protein